MATAPHVTEGDTTQPAKLSRPALLNRVQHMQQKIQELERLTNILSRGKYVWESTFDAIQAPVTIIASDYTLQRANLALAAAAGGDIRHLVGKKCYEVFAGRTSPCEGCPAQAALTREWPEKHILNHPIHQREYEVQAYPFAGAKGGENALVMHYRDITEEHRLQQELIQQEKMAAIGMLAGGVAHEINNPLGGILAFTQLLIRDCKENEAVRNDLEEIERAALRCKKIVQDLLDFSRLSHGREKSPVNVNELLERSFGFLRRELLSLNVVLKTQLEDAVSPVLGDANRLQQVFLNLMTNAIHAMPKGGTLTVTTNSKAAQREIQIVVADTGVGIAPEHLGKVFDPFFTTKSPGKGTGLGLSLSYRIITEHRGSIAVESTQGSGAKFTVHLPMVGRDKGEGR